MAKLLLVGDIHGPRRGAHMKYSSPDSTIIQVGDMGIGFGYTPQSNLKELHGIDYFIRGNHDNPELSRNHPQYLGEYGFNKELNVFYVSGAESVDQYNRVEGWDWWPEEQLSNQELHKMVGMYLDIKPDYVVTHDAPFSVPVQMGLVRTKTRCSTNNAFDVMFDLHKPKVWAFGHYHESKEKVLLGTKFVCIGEHKTYSLITED